MEKCWIVMQSAVKSRSSETIFHHQASVVVGSEEKALGTGYKNLEEDCPKKDGWEKHEVSLTRITKSWLQRALRQVEE